MLNPLKCDERHRDGWFRGVGNIDLYWQGWFPSGGHGPNADSAVSATAVVVLVHGLGSHSGLFGPIVRQLLDQNYRVYSFDLRGHGRSRGQRGYINRWSEFRDDLRQFLHWVGQQERDRPCFLLGHSLGGAIALDYALRFPENLAGLILTAPALSSQGISPIKVKIGRWLSMVWPRFSLNTGLRRRPPSRDAVVNQTYAQDALRHTRGTARLSTEFAKTNRHSWSQLRQLRIPLLLLQGTADPVAPIQVARQFFQQLALLDKTFYVYAGGYHEIWNDINRNQVIADISDWLVDVGARASTGMSVGTSVDASNHVPVPTEATNQAVARLN